MHTLTRTATSTPILLALTLGTLAACGGTSDTFAPIDEAELGAEAVSGTVGGKDFSLASGTLSSIGTSKVISLRSYPWECTGNANPPPEGALLINFGVITQAAGVAEVEYGDSHAATLQSGIGAETSAAQHAPVKKGLIRLDTWTTEVGQQVTGALLFRNDDDEVNGTFSATVCK